MIFPSTINDRAAHERNPSAGAGPNKPYDWQIFIDAIAEGVEDDTNKIKRGITPMDHDCCVEINHFHLIGETKEKIANFPNGQRMALFALVDTGLITLLVIEGKSINPIKWYSVDSVNGRSKMHKGDRARVKQELYDYICNWARMANSAENTIKETWRLRMLEACFKDAKHGMKLKMKEIITRLT